MQRKKKTITVRELKNSIHKVNNLIDKSKTMCMNMYREGKIRTVDPIRNERETEKRQKRISGERQRLAKILKKFNDARETEVRKSASMRDLLRFTKYMEKTIPKYINFLVKNGFLLDKYLVKCPDVFPVQPQKNEKDTAQWFNLEDIKKANELSQCWKFISEWKKFFYNYKRLMWGERSGTRERNIKTYYYMRHRGKELKCAGKKRRQIYEIVSKEITKLFGHCPGVIYQNDGTTIDTEYQTIQNASRFWHILGDHKYDRDEYKNLRVTYTERDGKKKSIPLRTWYRKQKSKLTRI